MIIKFLFTYAIISVFLFICMDILYKTHILETLPAPKSKIIYYIIQFTWGLPMNIIGCLYALIMVCHGHLPERYGWNFCFEFNNIGFGLELGIFFIARPNSIKTKNHEVGHSIQNLYLGIFTIGVISIPSMLRYWLRELISLINKHAVLPSYDSAWFEGQATKSGTKFINSL